MYYKNSVTPVSGLMNYLLFFSDGHRLIRYIPVGNNCEKREVILMDEGYCDELFILSQTLELVETKIILQCMYMYEVVPTVKNTE